MDKSSIVVRTLQVISDVTYMKKLTWIISIAWLFLIPLSLYSQDTTQTSTRPKVDIILSGGGAKGAAHIGVLKYIEEMGIPIDYIAG